MSFEIGICKDALLTKLGAAKDRAAAALRQLDNCDVKLKIVTTNTKDDTIKMPVVRSKSKCKHYTSHEEERLHGSGRYHDDWSSDEGYDSDCSCSNVATSGRGRRSYRDADVYIDGGNASQQNIQVQGCCDSKCRHNNRRRPRSRPIIVFERSRSGPCNCSDTRPCHHDGHCCIHGTGYKDFCSRCPRGQRQWEPYYHMSTPQQNMHRIITDDDGKMHMYDSSKLSKFLCDQAQAYAKSEADKKSSNEKHISEAMGILNKMCKPNFMSGGCGCGGSIHNCGMYNGSRSAQEIRNELAHVNADLDQLHARALLEAQAQACLDSKGKDSMEDLTLCSGALQEDAGGCDREILRGASRIGRTALKPRPLKPALKKVSFADDIEFISAGRVEELGSDDDLGCLEKPGCCSGCSGGSLRVREQEDCSYNGSRFQTQ